MKITDNFVFFWGYQDVLSNFYVVDETFPLYGMFPDEPSLPVTCNTSERAYMMFKAMYFNDLDTVLAIANAKSPKEQKKLGRGVKGFDDAVWTKAKERYMLDAVRAKFKVPRLRQALLDTGDRILAEASPVDAIWGIGLAEDHADAERVENWRGHNLLGQVLMQLRSELRAEDAKNKELHQAVLKTRKAEQKAIEAERKAEKVRRELAELEARQVRLANRKACKCGSKRFIDLWMKHNDLASFKVAHLGIDTQGYMPYLGKIFGGDDTGLTICIDCGSVQSWESFNDTEISNALKSEDEE